MLAGTVLLVKMLSEHADREVNFILSSYLNKPSVSRGFHKRRCILNIRDDNDLDSDLGNAFRLIYYNHCFLRKDVIVVET